MSYLINPTSRCLFVKSKRNSISNTILRVATNKFVENSINVANANGSKSISSSSHNLFPFEYRSCIGLNSNAKNYSPIKYSSDEMMMRLMSSKSEDAAAAANEERNESSEKTNVNASKNDENEDRLIDEEEEEKELTKEEELQNEVSNLKNQLLRSLAEQENTRRIAKRDIDSARQYAITSFAKNLLDTSDNLSRAMESVPMELLSTQEENDDGINDDKVKVLSQTLTTLYEGIKMTEDGLIKSFEKNGLVRYGNVGDVFDPNLHNALYEYVDNEKKEQPGSIGQIVKKGFMLHGRTIRPAEVGVIKKV